MLVSAARLSGASHNGRYRRLQPLIPLQNPVWRRDDNSGSRAPVTAGTDLVLMLTRLGDPVDPAAAGLLAMMAPYPCTLVDDGEIVEEVERNGLTGTPQVPVASSSASGVQDELGEGAGGERGMETRCHTHPQLLHLAQRLILDTGC